MRCNVTFLSNFIVKTIYDIFKIKWYHFVVFFWSNVNNNIGFFENDTNIIISAEVRLPVTS